MKFKKIVASVVSLAIVGVSAIMPVSASYYAGEVIDRAEISEKRNDKIGEKIEERAAEYATLSDYFKTLKNKGGYKMSSIYNVDMYQYVDSDGKTKNITGTSTSEKRFFVLVKNAIIAGGYSYFSPYEIQKKISGRTNSWVYSGSISKHDIMIAKSGKYYCVAENSGYGSAYRYYTTANEAVYDFIDTINRHVSELNDDYAGYEYYNYNYSAIISEIEMNE